MSRRKWLLTGIFGCMMTCSMGIRAEVPETILIQGTLEAAGGGPLTGSHEYLIRFFDASVAGTELSAATGIMQLSDAGRFSIALWADPLILETTETWYELAVDTDDDGIDPDDVFPDRIAVRSVPFALLSADSQRLAGLTGASYSTDEERESALAGKADVSHDHSDLYWALDGNVLSITEEAYIGSMNNQILVMITNGQSALRLEPGAGSPNLVGGYGGNAAGLGVDGGTIGGGGRDLAINQVTTDYATVGGGAGNIAGGYAAGVGAGEGNAAGGSYSSVGGGSSNTAAGSYTTVAGGASNSAAANYAAVSGGLGNSATATFSVIGGGSENRAAYSYATIGGGRGNTVAGSYGTISGGGPSDLGNPTTSNNQVHDDYGSVGGGGGNVTGSDDGDTTTQQYATVSGGENNTANNTYSTVGGGSGNVASGYAAEVGGGVENVASNSYAALGGGSGNTAGGSAATVAGGFSNTAGGNYATLSGGRQNTASAAFATVGGGISNSAAAAYSTIPGGVQNYAGGAYSFAAGYKARAEHNGSFVWSDSTGTEFSSTAANQFLISASGGVGIGTNSPTQMLTVRGNGLISGEDGPALRSVYHVVPGVGILQAARAISAYGNCIAVVSYATNTLTLLDVSNPDNPVFLGYTTSQLHGPVDVQVQGQLAYVASQNSDSLVILDISYATRPKSLGSTNDNLDGPKAVYVSGKYAYVASSGVDGRSDGLAVFDVSDPRNILAKGFINTNLDGTSDVYVAGKYAYVTSRNNNRLAVFDISDPDDIVPRGFASDFLSSPVAVHVRGAYAYVLGEGSNNLVVFNVSDPDNITYLEQASSSLTQPRSVFVSGDYAYVAFAGDPATSANCGLATFDISDPANIQVLKVIDMSGSLPVPEKPVAITGNGAHLFVAYERHDAVGIYDINHLESPAIETGALQAGYLDVTDNATINNDLNVRSGLHVGPGGAQIEGNLSVAGRDNSYILGKLSVGAVGIFEGTEENLIMYPTHQLDVSGEGRFRVNDYMNIILRSPNAGSDEDGYIDFVSDSHINVVTPSARIGFDKADPFKDETTITFWTKSASDAAMIQRAVIDASGNLRPSGNDFYSLGDEANRWTWVYTVNGVNQSSDVRLKENIVDLTHGLEEVSALRPVAFTWKKGLPGDVHYGLVAQEVAEVLPEVVSAGHTPEGTLSINYGELVPVLVKAIQEQQAQIEAQAGRIAVLEERLARLPGQSD